MVVISVTKSQTLILQLILTGIPTLGNDLKIDGRVYNSIGIKKTANYRQSLVKKYAKSVITPI
jgi:hypothetical protein